jgi:hypothetical protein
VTPISVVERSITIFPPSTPDWTSPSTTSRTAAEVVTQTKMRLAAAAASAGEPAPATPQTFASLIRAGSASNPVTR